MSELTSGSDLAETSDGGDVGEQEVLEERVGEVVNRRESSGEAEKDPFETKKERRRKRGRFFRRSSESTSALPLIPIGETGGRKQSIQSGKLVESTSLCAIPELGTVVHSQSESGSLAEKLAEGVPHSLSLSVDLDSGLRSPNEEFPGLARSPRVSRSQSIQDLLDVNAPEWKKLSKRDRKLAEKEKKMIERRKKEQEMEYVRAVREADQIRCSLPSDADVAASADETGTSSPRSASSSPASSRVEPSSVGRSPEKHSTPGEGSVDGESEVLDEIPSSVIPLPRPWRGRSQGLQLQSLKSLERAQLFEARRLYRRAREKAIIAAEDDIAEAEEKSDALILETMKGLDVPMQQKADELRKLLADGGLESMGEVPWDEIDLFLPDRADFVRKQWFFQFRQRKCILKREQDVTSRNAKRAQWSELTRLRSEGELSVKAAVERERQRKRGKIGNFEILGVTLDDILEDSVSLIWFEAYAAEHRIQHLVEFLVMVQRFRKQFSDILSDFDAREAERQAWNIYSRFISPWAVHVQSVTRNSGFVRKTFLVAQESLHEFKFCSSGIHGEMYDSLYNVAFRCVQALHRGFCLSMFWQCFLRELSPDSDWDFRSALQTARDTNPL